MTALVESLSMLYHWKRRFLTLSGMMPDAVGRYERKETKAEFDWHDVEAAEAPRRKKGILFSVVIALVRKASLIT